MLGKHLNEGVKIEKIKLFGGGESVMSDGKGGIAWPPK